MGHTPVSNLLCRLDPLSPSSVCSVQLPVGLYVIVSATPLHSAKRLAAQRAPPPRGPALPAAHLEAHQEAFRKRESHLGFNQHIQINLLLNKSPVTQSR